MTYAPPARNFMAVLTNAAIAAFYEQFCWPEAGVKRG